MTKLFIFMLVMLNPFAQALYLADLIADLNFRDFLAVHFRATVLSFGVFGLFALLGETILEDIFQVRLAALQIFGGLIMLVVAFRYITVGPQSNLMFKGDLADIAPNISLPYMVGPGTIWLSILIGRDFPPSISLSMITGVLSVNMAFLAAVKLTTGRLRRYKQTLVGKYFAIMMRVNALFIGAIATEMILTGIVEAIPLLKTTNGG